MYEERFVRFATMNKKRGVVFIAISSSLLPPDSPEKMRERATQKGFAFDYLSDPTQQIGRAYGATVTPQLFVLDRERCGTSLIWENSTTISSRRKSIVSYGKCEAVHAPSTESAPRPE